MRGGIVAALAGVEMAGVERPVWMVLTPDEETGSAASAALISGRGAEAQLAIVPYRLSVAGRSAHPGLEREKGRKCNRRAGGPATRRPPSGTSALVAALVRCWQARLHTDRHQLPVALVDGLADLLGHLW